jgi:hypothetical protein
MIAGPLHGSTKKHVESEDWKWQQQDVSRYLGQRAHVEFRPAKPTQEMTVAVCLQGEHAPTKGQPLFDSLLLSLEQGNDAPHDRSELASRYQAAFAQACRAADESPNTADPGMLRLAAWCYQHEELFAYDSDAQAEVGNLLAEYQRDREKLIAQIKASPTAMAMMDANGFDEQVLLRGSPKTPGPPAPRRFLEALGGAEHPITAAGSGRLDLAGQMVDPRNPLTSRVMVNRVWHHMFGRGLVPSVDNFGELGQKPSHPELLDYLSTQFVEDGWSIKRLIRGLMLSSTYQMSSQLDAAADLSDPQNALLHRANIRRLQGEAIRDTLLVLSGRFDGKLFGASVPVHLTPFMEGRGKPESGPLDGAGRRSIYTKVRRNFLSPMMLAFDMPIPFNTMGRRSLSNVPAQALIMLNDPLVVQSADGWADRVLKDSNVTPSERIRRLYLEAFAHEPNAKELEAALDFLQQDGELLEIPVDLRLQDRRVWAHLAHVLMNTKEFIFIN